jgi:hypothetical protein
MPETTSVGVYSKSASKGIQADAKAITTLTMREIGELGDALPSNWSSVA